MSYTILDTHRDAILKELCKRYNLENSQIEHVQDGTSFNKETGDYTNKAIYKSHSEGNDYFYRITIPEYNTKETIELEVEWLSHLKREGLSVCEALPSGDGELIENVSVEDSYISIVKFKGAKGSHISDDGLNDSVLEKWGVFVGKMHEVAKEYDKTFEGFPTWEEYPIFLQIEKHVPRQYQELIEVFHRQKELLSFPPERSRKYGLTHGDFHQWNFYIHNNRMTAFDFDFCEINWYMNDIAIPLYYMLESIKTEESKIEKTKAFLKPFMRGYLSQVDKKDVDLTQLPELMIMRHIASSIEVFEESDVSAFTEEEKSVFESNLQKILKKEPIVNLDFTKLQEELISGS